VAGGDLASKLADDGYLSLYPRLEPEPCVRWERNDTLLLTLWPRSVTLFVRLNRLPSRRCSRLLSTSARASKGGGLGSSEVPSLGCRRPVSRCNTLELLAEMDGIPAVGLFVPPFWDATRRGKVQ